MELRFASQEAEVVSATGNAPNTSWSMLLIGTLAAMGAQVLPSILSVALPLFQADKGQGLYVDFAAPQLFPRLEGPTPGPGQLAASVGGTCTEPRLWICCCFEPVFS